MEEFASLWRWYLGLLSDEDNKVKIAAWTATIATITFALNFILKPIFNTYLNQKFAKVKVVAEIKAILLSTVDGIKDAPPIINCIVTNHDSKAVYIQNPIICLSRKIKGRNGFVFLTPQYNFPLKLEPEQQVTFPYDSFIIYNELLRYLESKDKVHFIVETTTGKKYTSNRFIQKDIVQHVMTIHERMNSQKN